MSMLSNLAIWTIRCYGARMKLTIVQSQWNGFRIDGLTPDHVLDVRPEPGFERGREAKLLSDLWLGVRDSGIEGLLLLGCDVAADPGDYELMQRAVTYQPRRVHTGLVKLWPASTGRSEWMWSHRGGTMGNPEAGQGDIRPVVYFSLGFLWVPRALLDVAFPAYQGWRWGQMDTGLSELAFHHRINVQLVAGCEPRHMHFTKAHNR